MTTITGSNNTPKTSNTNFFSSVSSILRLTARKKKKSRSNLTRQTSITEIIPRSNQYSGKKLSINSQDTSKRGQTIEGTLFLF